MSLYLVRNLQKLKMIVYKPLPYTVVITHSLADNQSLHKPALSAPLQKVSPPLQKLG